MTKTMCISEGRVYENAAGDIIVILKTEMDGIKNIFYTKNEKILMATEEDFKNILKTGFYEVVEIKKEKEKQITVDGKTFTVGDSTKSKDGQYTAIIDNIDSYEVRIKITHDVDSELTSNIYRNYARKDFNLENVFTDKIIEQLDSMKNGPRLLDADLDSEAIKRLKEAIQGYGVKDPKMKEIIEYANRIKDKDFDIKDEKLLELLQNLDWDSAKVTKEHAATINPNEPCEGIKMGPFFITPEGSEKEAEAGKEYGPHARICKPSGEAKKHFGYSGNNLFEVIGEIDKYEYKTGNIVKESKFTIVGDSIDTRLMEKIKDMKPGIKIYQIKRIGTIDLF